MPLLNAGFEDACNSIIHCIVVLKNYQVPFLLSVLECDALSVCILSFLSQQCFNIVHEYTESMSTQRPQYIQFPLQSTTDIWSIPCFMVVFQSVLSYQQAMLPSVSKRVILEQSQPKKTFWNLTTPFSTRVALQDDISPFSSRFVLPCYVVPVLMYGCKNWIVTERLIDRRFRENWWRRYWSGRNITLTLLPSLLLRCWVCDPGCADKVAVDGWRVVLEVSVVRFLRHVVSVWNLFSVMECKELEMSCLPHSMYRFNYRKCSCHQGNQRDDLYISKTDECFWIYVRRRLDLGTN